MKHIDKYLFENIKEFKKYIIDKCNSLDEDTLKKVVKYIDRIGLDKSKIDEIFDLVGLSSIKNLLYKSICMMDDGDEIFYEFMINKEDKEHNKISIDEFIKNNNIYELIISNHKKNNFASDSNISYESLEELSQEFRGTGKNLGRFEVLALMFLDGITKNNIGHSDVNVIDPYDNKKTKEFEFKCSGARICGQETLRSPKFIYISFEKELTKLLKSNKNIDEEFFNDITGDNFKKYDFLKNKNICEEFFTKIKTNEIINNDSLSKILGTSLLKQINNSEELITKEESEKFEEYIKSKNVLDNVNKSADLLRIILLSMHMYYYHKTHQFDYLVVFGHQGPMENKTGKYVCIEFNKDETFDSIESKLKEYSVKPAKGLSSNTIQEYASMISLLSNKIK